MTFGFGFKIGHTRPKGVPSILRYGDVWWAYKEGIYSPAIGWPTDTHAYDITMQDRNGIYQTKAANVLCRENGVGLQTVPGRTELTTRPIPTAALPWSYGANPLTPTYNATTAPDGSNNGTLYARTTTASCYGGPGNVTKAASAIQYTQSMIVKAGTCSHVALRLQGTYPNRADVCFNLTTGAVSLAALATSSFTSATAGIEDIGVGWFLIWLTATSDTALALSPYFSPRASSGQIDAADTSDSASLNVWNMNVQAAAFPITPILTGGGAINGNQQVSDLSAYDLSNGVAGVLVVDIKDTGSNYVRPIELNDGASSNRVSILYTGGNMQLQVWAGGTNYAAVTLGAWPTGLQAIPFAVAENYAWGQIAGGGAVTADTTVTLPSMDRVSVGGGGYSANSNCYGVAPYLGLKFNISGDPAAAAAEALAKATALKARYAA